MEFPDLIPVPRKLNTCGYMQEYFQSRSLLGHVVYLPTRPSILVRNLLLRYISLTRFDLEEGSTSIDPIWFSGFFTGFQGSSPGNNQFPKNPIFLNGNKRSSKTTSAVRTEQRQGLPLEDSVKQRVPRSPLFRGRSRPTKFSGATYFGTRLVMIWQR